MKLVTGAVTAVIVILALLLAATLHPLAATEYVTVYVPGVLPARLITPVEALMDKPAGALKVPPVVKPGAVVGAGFVPLAQTGDA